jgi:hypothetical protein
MHWSDRLKLGRSSAFVKRDLRRLPLTEAAFEADFFLDTAFAGKRPECWVGMVIEREFGGVPATEDVRFGPPTVNELAALLARAMLRPLNAQDRQRPSTIYLRNRPQWQELLPHLRQLGIEVVLSEDLPGFDEAVLDWMQEAKTQNGPSTDQIKAALRQPFPKRRLSWFTEAIDLMAWTEAMPKRACSSGQGALSPEGPMTVVPIPLTASDELRPVVTAEVLWSPWTVRRDAGADRTLSTMT